MKLTIEQLSKATKLSIPTLRVYVSRQKLGKKIGNKRVFSQTDVQKLLQASKKSPSKKRIVYRTGKAATGRNVIKPKPTKADISKAPTTKMTTNAAAAKTTKPSFWTRLLGGRKPKQKVGLLDAKMTSKK